MVHTYGDIPDHVPSKGYYPLARNIWQVLKEMGWDYLKPALSSMIDNFHDIVKLRLDEAIKTAQSAMKGELSDLDKIFSYFFFPPVLEIRTDLQQGTSKLLYGESVDVTYITLSDETGEFAFLLNCHGEDGIPVDWYLVGADDELMERRHMKLGFKLKEAYKKTKGLTQTAARTIDILKDVRNERTPQWSNAAYFTIIVWGLGVSNAGLEVSNYENIAFLHDGVNNRQWGLPDPCFTFFPWPAFIKILFDMDRANYTKRFTGLSSENKLCCHSAQFPGLADYTGGYEFFTNYPEAFDLSFKRKWEKEGVPFPIQTLETQMPKLKKTLPADLTELDFKVPKGDRIFAEDLDLTLEEAIKGVYLDYDHETKPRKAKPEDMISKDCGVRTEVL
ncbi:MAG: hypothetical protein ACTSO9_04860 [Candidatus Helarchaeota archaeon]